MTKDEIISLASDQLGNSSLKEVEQNSKLVEGVGYFFWKPIRGGQQFVIGFDGGYLFGISALSMDQIVDAYIEGKRTT